MPFFVWASYPVISSQYRLSMIVLLDLIWTVIFAVLVFVTQSINLFPDFMTDYGAIWQTFHVISWLLWFILSGTRSRFLYLIGTVIGFGILLLDGVATFFSVTSLLLCYDGILPLECRENQLFDILSILISVTFFLITFSAWMHVFYVLRRVWRANRKIKNE